MTCPCQCATFAEHIRSIGYSYKAAPATNRRETVLARDLAAFKSLTENGLEPKRVDGMAELVARDAPAHVIEGRPEHAGF